MVLAMGLGQCAFMQRVEVHFQHCIHPQSTVYTMSLLVMCSTCSVYVNFVTSSNKYIQLESLL